MKPAVPLLALLLACGLGAAAADPLHSPACRSALASLSSAENEAISSRGAAASANAAGTTGTSHRIGTARRAVLRDCLGTDADLGPPPARARAPVAVDSALSARPWATPGAAAPSRTPPLPTPLPMRPLLTITGCDPAGCWASDGSRLQRQGTLLLGPRGYCSAVGGVLNCP
jgi:hypothetical protein